MPIIRTEKSRERIKHFENSLYKINDEILLTNWVNKINPKKQYYERENLSKEAIIKDMRVITLRELFSKLNINF